MKVLMFIFLFFLLVFIGIVGFTWYRLYTSLHVHVSADQKNLNKYAELTSDTRFFTASDGQKIAAFYVAAPHPKAFVILVHGYETKMGGKAWMLGYAKGLRDAGYSSLVIDLRSNGDSPGNMVTLGVKEWRDVVGAYDYMRTLPETKNKKVGFLGISMGAATSIIAAGESGKGDFVIASVPFATYADLLPFRVMKAGLPSVLFGLPARIAAFFALGFDYPHYDPMKEIVKIHSPILIFRALNDKSVPSIDAKQLFEAAHDPKTLWEAQSGHDIFAEKPQEFMNSVISFLGKYAY